MTLLCQIKFSSFPEFSSFPDLLESAAVSVDSLKTENMSCQKSLLNAKDYLFCPTKMNSYPSSEKHGCY